VVEGGLIELERRIGALETMVELRWLWLLIDGIAGVWCFKNGGRKKDL
jgi:hypothetical protein